MNAANITEAIGTNDLFAQTESEESAWSVYKHSMILLLGECEKKPGFFSISVEEKFYLLSKLVAFPRGIVLKLIDKYFRGETISFESPILPDLSISSSFATITAAASSSSPTLLLPLRFRLARGPEIGCNIKAEDCLQLQQVM